MSKWDWRYSTFIYNMQEKKLQDIHMFIKKMWTFFWKEKLSCNIGSVYFVSASIVYLSNEIREYIIFSWNRQTVKNEENYLFS